MLWVTIAPTQKVLANEPSLRDPSRYPPNHPNPQISETAYLLGRPVCFSAVSLGISS